MKTIVRVLAIATLFLTAPLVAQSADVSVVKTGPALAKPGTDVTYTVTVANSGPNDAVAVALSDIVPPEMTFFSLTQSPGSVFICTTPAQGAQGTVSCTAALLAAGASEVFTLVFSIPGATPSGSVAINTATVSSQTPDPDNGDHSSTVETFIGFNADLFTTKTGPATANADTDVSYTVTITNAGPDDAPNVILRDQIPIGPDLMPFGMTFVSVTQDSGPTFVCSGPDGLGNITCTNGVLPAGVSAVFTFVFHIPASTAPGTEFTNTATASSDATDPMPENNGSFATTSTPPPPRSDVLVTKNGPGSAGPDTDVVYTIVVSNAGPDAAANLLLEDTLPSSGPPTNEDMTFVSLGQSGPFLNCTTPAVGAPGSIQCTSASYPAGGTTTLTLTGHIPAASSAGDTFVNTATVSSDNEDPSGENDVSSVATVVSSADVVTTKDGPTTANAGTDLTYTIVLTNDGPDAATSVTFSDPLPPQTTFVSLLQDNGPPANCATIAPGTNGTVGCTIGVLNPGQSAQFSLTIHIGNTTSITNVATTTTDTFDPDSSDNSDSATTTVTPIADVRVTKSGPATITAGTDFTYTIVVANDGPSDASNVSLTDTLPPNVTFVSLMQSGGPVFNCTNVNCTIATMPPNSATTFTVTAHLASSAPNGSPVDNTADVAATTTDPDGLDNSSTTNATVATSADVSVVKTGPALAEAASTFTYTITVANNGPSDASTVELLDTLPSNVTVVTASQTSGPTFTCTFPAAGTTGTIDCDITTLASGASATFSIDVMLSPSAPDGSSLANTANVTTTTSDPDTNNNTSTTTATVGSEADVSIMKTGPATVTAGSNISYTVIVSNAGPADAANVTVTDVVPANTVFVSATQDNGPTFACNTPAPGSAGTITCTRASLAVNASAQFTFVFRSTGGTPIQNTATVSASNDITPGNGSSTVASAVGFGESVPTLSEWALIAMAAGLLLVVMLRLR